MAANSPSETFVISGFAVASILISLVSVIIPNRQALEVEAVSASVRALVKTADLCDLCALAMNPIDN